MAKRRKKKATPAEFIDAADDFLAANERAAETSRREVEPIRLELSRAGRAGALAALANMGTARFGRTRVLVPTQANQERIKLEVSRQEERFSRFKLQWLDKGQVRRLISEGFTKADQREFFRHSNRLAKNARAFLGRIGELEPSLQDEIDATILQIDEASNDLTKLEVRSWTQLSEQLQRNVQGRVSRVAAMEDLRTYDLNRNLWNLSLLEHPKGVVRELMANASERMAARVTTKDSQLPSRALVFVGAGPDAVSKMTPNSRTAQVLWRLFSAEELDRRYRKINSERGTTSTWRNLGLGHNSPDFYVPVPPEIADEVREEMRKRREDFRSGLTIKE